MIIFHLTFVLIITAKSQAQDASTTAVPSSTYQTTQTSKSSFNLTTSGVPLNATTAAPSNIVKDVEKMINSLVTIPPITLEQLLGPVLQTGKPQPAIDINKILKSIPSLPPIQIPTIDPSFFAKLPTLPPFVLPTLDPDFFKNLPTIAPIQFPTIDPDFFKNLPTLPPFPTLDPNIFKGWPTLPPFKLPETSFGNSNATCIPKLLKFARDNETFQGELQEFAQQGKATNAISHAVEESKELCEADQVTKLSAFVQKHMETFELMDKFAPNFTEEERLKVFQWLITENSMALTAFSGEKGLQNLFNPSFGMEMMNLSLRISGMQMELVFQPI